MTTRFNLAELRAKYVEDISVDLPWWFPAEQFGALVDAVEAAENLRHHMQHSLTDWQGGEELIEALARFDFGGHA